MDPITVTIGDIEVEVHAVEGVLVDGNLKVSSVEAEVLGRNFHSLNEEISWNEEEVREAVRSAWMQNSEWPDTLDPQWKEHRLVNPGTQEWNVLEYIEDNYPCKTRSINEELDYGDNLKNVVYDLKEDNLITAVARDGNAHILVPTHLGLKELYLEGGLENVGLDNLFNNNNSEEEDEEAEENDK